MASSSSNQKLPDDPPGSGLAKFWWFPNLFFAAGVWHDLVWDIRKEEDLSIYQEAKYASVLTGEDWEAAYSAAEQSTSRDADYGYYYRCIKEAKESSWFWCKVKHCLAPLFYQITRIYGERNWGNSK